MPIYEYECRGCGPFDLQRPVALRNDAAACPSCAAIASRVMLSAPLLSSMHIATRTARERNERAAHEPVRSASHAPGCGCCSRKVSLPRSGEPATRSSAGRPWMISH